MKEAYENQWKGPSKQRGTRSAWKKNMKSATGWCLRRRQSLHRRRKEPVCSVRPPRSSVRALTSPHTTPSLFGHTLSRFSSCSAVLKYSAESCSYTNPVIRMFVGRGFFSISIHRGLRLFPNLYKIILENKIKIKIKKQSYIFFTILCLYFKFYLINHRSSHFTIFNLLLCDKIF